MREKFFPILIVLVTFFSCRQRYEPDVKSLKDSFLVVEGNLNTGVGSTLVHLTRTFKLDDTVKLKAENNAQLTVEGKDNSIHGLVAIGNGYYSSASLNLIINNEYRLRIKTATGPEYLSDYVKAKSTPDIDSVNWERDNEGVHLYVNTNDPSGNSRYYRWDYEETWEIRSYFYSRYIYQNGIVRPRIFPAEDVYVCWKYNRPTEILLANSTQLREDLIYKKLLTLIPEKNERLQIRYSILVKQYALEKEAYDFFEIMKKNTEEIGSFFAPLPSGIKGNIHSLADPDEPVIGYITVSEEKQKRIFITISPWGFFIPCSTVEVPAIRDSINYYFGSAGYIVYDYSEPPPVYYGTPPVCADCTSRGGSTAKPSYW